MDIHLKSTNFVFSVAIVFVYLVETSDCIRRVGLSEVPPKAVSGWDLNQYIVDVSRRRFSVHIAFSIIPLDQRGLTWEP